MEMYKKLNKELVEKIQEMKTSVREYRIEILYLTDKYLEEKAARIRLKEKCIALARDHCQQYLYFLDPSSELLTHLSTSATTPPSRNRQSLRLAEEARRSCSVMQTRQSLNAMSPIRTPADEDENDNDNIEEIEATFSSRRSTVGGIVEENEDDDDEAQLYRIERNSESDHDISYIPNLSNDTTAVEENQESATLEANNSSTDVTTFQTINDSSTENILHQEDEPEENSENAGNSIFRKTLRDVTNTQRLDQGKLMQNRENVNLSRNKRTNLSMQQKTIDSPVTDRSDISFDEIRHCSRLQKKNESTFKLSNQNASGSNFSLTDLTMDEFHAGSTSTPNNKNSSRPQRKCKPTSLTEPALNVKLRNESAEQSLGVKKSSKNSK